LSRFSLCFRLCLILRAVRLLRHGVNAFLRDRLFVLWPDSNFLCFLLSANSTGLPALVLAY
jgi:hypothetical protein